MDEQLSDPFAGDRAYERDHFTCIYCGFDGRTFDAWMQLTIDHIRPRSSNGGNEKDNLAVACGSCNRTTCRMTFDSTKTREEIIREKRKFVKERREHFYVQWLKSVALAFWTDRCRTSIPHWWKTRRRNKYRGSHQIFHQLSLDPSSVSRFIGGECARRQ